MADPFLVKVIERNTDPETGRLRDPRLLARMQNPVCQACHERYKQKFPGQPFLVHCQGIFDDRDYEHLAAETGATVDEVKSILDLPTWASEHVRVVDSDGEISPFKAREYQLTAMVCTAQRQVDRWGRGLGKALALDTPIPSSSGWKTMGDLQPGDVIFDAEGQPTTVTFATEVMYGRPCYEVKFSDGSSLVADGEHQWETWTHTARKAESRKTRRTGKLAHVRPTPKPEVRTTEQIRKTLLHGSGKRIEHNHSIQVCGALQYSQKVLPIEPYVFGVWLGDGSSRGGEVTTVEPEIIHQMAEAGYLVDQKPSDDLQWTVKVPGHIGPGRNPLTGGFVSNGSFTSLLRNLGVWGNKHVPRLYLEASVKQRLALLQGLMDTDGYVQSSGTCTFYNCNRRLAHDVYELIVGLGIKAGFTIKRVTLNERVVGDCFCINFTTARRVFRVHRKFLRQKTVVRRTQHHRYIVAVTPVESVPVRCIQVDNPRSLYLAGRACIPTHNTVVGVIKELHRATTRKNYRIMIICPAKSQAQMWWEMINEIVNRDDELSQAIASSKQQPYYLIKWHNGSSIAIFTAGSQSGRDSASLRGYSPHRVRIDEQDQLNAGDYKAIMPLLRRFKNSEFQGSSTPTGARETFWAMCTQYPDYQEFHFPITVHPDFSAEMEEACRREARTEINYLHEFLAEFGDQEGGVFKSLYIDMARSEMYSYAKCRYSPRLRYFMGVDWNGQGTGTRIRVVAYDPETHKRRVVASQAVVSSNQDSIDAIRLLNQRWHCEEIYVDAGFGFVQDELLRLVGHNSRNEDDRRLRNIKVIDFGAEIKTNRLIPKRGYTKYRQDMELVRRTKPFMVEGAVMCLEQGLFEFSPDDAVLDEQLRAYRVKTWSAHGYANTYECGKAGDHDLDATMLALLGIELKYGLFESSLQQRRSTIENLMGFATPELDQRLAQVQRNQAENVSPPPSPDLPAAKRKLMKAIRGIPSRTAITEDPRVLHAGRGVAYVAFPQQSRMPGRTSRLLPSQQSRDLPARQHGSGRMIPSGGPPNSIYRGRRHL